MIKRRRQRGGRQPQYENPNLNKAIRAKTLRVIDVNGENSVMAKNEALELAQEHSLDLVLVGPNSNPPVAKIMDYGKYQYEQQKRKKENAKKQHKVVVKEIKMTPNIGDHDLQTKLKHMSKFLDEGNKVKIIIRFKGRGIVHKDLGFELLDKITAEFNDRAAQESKPTFEGKNLTVIYNVNK